MTFKLFYFLDIQCHHPSTQQNSQACFQNSNMRQKTNHLSYQCKQQIIRDIQMVHTNARLNNRSLYFLLQTCIYLLKTLKVYTTHNKVLFICLPGSSLHGLSVEDLHGSTSSRMNLVIHHMLETLVVCGAQKHLCIHLTTRMTIV